MAYILGFMFADGNMTVAKRGGYYFALYSNDLTLLKEILSTMKSNHKVSKRKEEACYRFQIGSREMFEDLIALGLTPDKSKRMIFPKIPRNYIGDFIRGFFDGDGNVWMGEMNKKRQFPTKVIFLTFTSASVYFLKDLQKVLHQIGISGGSIYKLKNKNCARLNLSTTGALKLSEIMYNTSSKLFLLRKKLIFERFVRNTQA